MRASLVEFKGNKAGREVGRSWWMQRTREKRTAAGGLRGSSIGQRVGQQFCVLSCQKRKHNRVACSVSTQPLPARPDLEQGWRVVKEDIWNTAREEDGFVL